MKYVSMLETIEMTGSNANFLSNFTRSFPSYSLNSCSTRLEFGNFCHGIYRRIRQDVCCALSKVKWYEDTREGRGRCQG